MNRTLLLCAILLQTAFLSTALICVEVASFAQTAGAQEHKLERGGKVSVSNHNGSISIRGWDKDVIEATAIGKGQSEPSAVKISEERPGVVSIGADSERGHRE